jgi:putative redox protein
LKVTLLAEDRLRLEAVPGALSIEAESPEMAYSPFHMVASGLATCIFSVLASWADTAKVPVDDLAVEVAWRFANEPHRVGSYEVALVWPGLPENRHTAARRVAGLCPIHATLHHPPSIEVEVTG